MKKLSDIAKSIITENSRGTRDTLRSKLVGVLNRGYDAKSGDRVVNLVNGYDETDKTRGVVVGKLSHGKYKIKWDRPIKPNYYTKTETDVTDSSLRYSGGTDWSWMIVLEKYYDEFMEIYNSIVAYDALLKDIDMEAFISDLRGGLNSKELMTKYNINDEQINHIMDSPEVRYAFS